MQEPTSTSARATASSAPAAAGDDLLPYCALRGVWPPGWLLNYVESTPSTQDLARSAGAREAPHGTVFVAEWQQAGRGRRGRQWLAPPGTALLFSILLRATRLDAFAQTAVCTLAICRVLERLGLAPAVKWPNDVLLSDRKLAGVLTERVVGAGQPYQVVGIGLNVHHAPSALPPFAIALSEAAGRPIARGPLLAAILAELAPLLEQPAAAWAARLHGEWSARLWRRHQQVRLGLDGDIREGRVEGAAIDGALLLRDAEGRLQRIAVGEVLL